MKYLVDTNVLSEVRKGPRCNDAVSTWWSSIDERAICVSILTIGELRVGIERARRHDPRFADALETWVRQLITIYQDRILTIDLATVEEWGRVTVPDPLPVIDGLLAATAKVHGLTLVTRNVRDVARTGVDMLNPWRP